MPDSEAGSSTAVAFALAGVLFIGAISTVLVYTNDRIPPPAKTRPHEEYGSEAHVLLQSLVLGCGTAPWTAGTGLWTEQPNTVTASNVPGLRYCDAAATDCASPICLDYARIAAFASACPSTQDSNLPPSQQTCTTPVTEQDGKYDYEDLRQILDLDAAERHFRIVIVDLNITDTNPDSDCSMAGGDADEECLLDYGEPIPGRTATQPATAYIELQHSGARDRHLLRVSVHVFHS